MDKKNILVTGGCGFIGSNFILNLLHDKKFNLGQIVNVDKLTYAGNPCNLDSIVEDPRYLFIKGDIAHSKRIREILDNGGINLIVNFAAESHVDRSIDSCFPFIETNVNGTSHLLQTILEYWRTLDKKSQQDFRFIHISTDEVYGDIPNLSVAYEDSPYLPNSPYAASKAASDHIVRSYNKTYGLPTIITHSSNNYGPYQFPEKLIPLVILNALEGKEIPVYGDGQQVRNWIHVEDNIEAIKTIIEWGHVGESYNIGDKFGMTNYDLISLILNKLDSIKEKGWWQDSYFKQIKYVQDRPGHDRRYAINSDKLNSLTSWMPKIPLHKGIEDTIQWYIENKKWCDDISTKKYNRERLGTIK